MVLCAVVAVSAQTSHPVTGCYWEWMNGNITKEGITKDLEYMKAAGLFPAGLPDVLPGDKTHAGARKGVREYKTVGRKTETFTSLL